MARLEIDIALNNLQGATNGLKELQKNLNNLSGKGVKIDMGKEGLAEARVETEKMRKALIEARIEKVKFNDVKATGLNEYQKLSRELTEMRNEAKSLGAQMIKLDAAGMKNSVVFNTLSNKFNESQKYVISLDSSLKKLDGSLGQSQRNVGNYQYAMGGVNGVTMEFNRIIQDAPFGMMGIGNNIQQLASNWQVYTQQTRAAAAETGKTVTTMSLVKGALSSIISPANLLTLGIAAITSAWTAYIMWSQKSAKATKESENTLKDYANQLKGVEAIQVKSISNYGQEISKLETLYKITQSASSSTKERKRALEQLQEIYPSVFKNLDIESVKTANAATQYEKLKNSIVAAAMAQAAYARIAELGENISVANKKRIAELERTAELEREIAMNIKKREDLKKGPLINRLAGAAGDFLNKEIDSHEAKAVREEIKKLDKQIAEDKAEQAKLADEVLSYEKQNTVEQEKQIKVAEKKNELVKKDLKQQVDYLQQIKDLQGDKEKDLDLVKVSGYARDLKELEWKYKEHFSNLSKIEKKYNADESKNKQSGVIGSLEEARKTSLELQKKEQEELEKKWLEKRNELTKSANDKWGFISETSREKDLASLNNYIEKYKKDLEEAHETTEKVAEKIASLKSTATFKINVEYYKPMLDDLDKENDSIAESINKPFTSSNTMKMRKELDERLRILRNRLTAQQAAYDKISTKKGGTDGVEKIMKETKEKWEAEISAEFSKQTLNDLVSSFNGAFSSFFSNLDNNVELFGSKVGGIFKSLAHSLLETIGGIMDSLNQKNNENVMNKLLDGGLGDFKKNWSEMMGSFEGKVSAMAAAGDLLGNAIGSLTKKTSELGQGVAGGLKGAAAGAQIGTSILPGLGTAIGAGIGGIIGGIKGIFGAKKAKKQEELQRQQLLEQQKANALLERMNALAYTSSIIGGQSQYGIVGGVNRSFDGQFEFVIDGQKMRSVLTNVDRFNGR